MVELCWDSSFGLGIFDGLFSKAGTCPLPWPRPGVPLKVPPAADMTYRACSSVDPYQINSMACIFDRSDPVIQVVIILHVMAQQPKPCQQTFSRYAFPNSGDKIQL